MFSLIYQSGFSVVVSTDFGLMVSYDAYSYVQISVPYTYQNATCGLCGNFNNQPQDDFRTRQGELVSSDVVFANSWQASGDDEPGCGPQCAGLACAGCTAEQTALYSNTDHCGILSSTSGPFAACHQQLPPQSFVDSCLYDLCLGGGYQPILCQALTVYASQCQQNGIQLPSWRRPGFCEIPCPANSHFESEGTGCPATCVNPNSTHNCPLPSQESCICDSGYILSGGVCVPHAECGCSFEGRYYRSGQTVILDENCGRRCSCSYGSMTCQPHGCGPFESCGLENGERGCRPNSYETCWIRGPGSYQTFDGLTYQYPGACRLTLAKVMGLSSHPNFTVTAEKVPRGQQDFSNVTINNSGLWTVKLPFSTGSNGIQIFYSSLRSVIIRTSFGVTVQTVWPHFVRVTAPGVYSRSLGGLCGDYNGNPHDDFRTPNGVLVNSSQDFGDSWRDGSLAAHCVESQDRDSRTDFNSSQYCGILRSPDGPFVPCWSVVDPRQQVDVCVEIMRGSNDPASTLCDALRDYALMCQQKGVALGQWRDATGCALTCPSNSHYELCGTTCPSACPSLSFPFTCDTVCQEGCQCNNGFILNGDQCVPPTSCGCYHQGRYRESGEQFWDGEECLSLCACNGTTGNVRCTPNSCGPQESCRVVEGEFGCHPNPHGTCYASGDPHYFTFDHKAYDFQGTCRYTLVTLCNATDDLNQFSVEAKNEPWNGFTVSVTAEVFVNVWGYHLHMSRDNRGVVEVRFFLVQNSLLGCPKRLIILPAVKPMSLFYLTVLIKRGKTCGLCGNFNGNSNDDFYTPSGVTVASPDEFGQAWKVPGNYTCSDGCGSSCPRCANEQPARDQCEVIQAADGPFSFCHEVVHPAPYFSDCVFDVCVAGNQGHDLLCRALETYVRACHSANVRIYPWRQNTTCSESTCHFNSHYELCGTDCGHTCARSNDSTCEQACSEGCFCDEGYRRSGTSCVPVAHCGCQHNGFYYNLGASFWSDSTCAQKCTCTSTGLQCRNQPCSFSQICKPASFQFSCQTVPRGTCTISGDPHYYTFDDTVFHFQGTCTYVLSEQCNSGLPYYRVEGKNEHRGSTRVAWTRLVKVHVYNDTIELVKGRRGEAKVNGNFASTPFSLSNDTVQVYESGFSVFVSTDFGLVVSYDTNHYVQISLPYTYQNATCGLCGNFNGIRRDDFQTREGEVVSSDVVFANSWQASGDDEPGCGPQCGGLDCAVCTVEETALYSNTDHCGILSSSSGPFAACHQQLPPQSFADSCVYDLCVGGGYQPILCQALSVYASQCQQNGIQLPSWRRPGFCEIPCPANSHFESEGTGCPATCVNPNSTHNCPLPPQESCICDSGYILSGGVCVPHAECGCSFEGRYYRSGQTVILDENCGRRCSCSYGSMTCQSHGCGPLESCKVEDGERGCRPNSYETCWIRGSGSYQTFDGLTYQYPGACRLTLAKVVGLSSHPHFMVTAEKVPRGQEGFARILHFEAEGIHVSIEMARNSKVKVSEWNTYLKLCSSLNYLFMCTRTQYCLSLVNCKNTG
uniref:VWFD domain-containing protein n=1 Tax=Oreochromis aureus TaxID=47969 RepID=A0AAZ1XYP6_OREAU